MPFPFSVLKFKIWGYFSAGSVCPSRTQSWVLPLALSKLRVAVCACDPSAQEAEAGIIRSSRSTLSTIRFKVGQGLHKRVSGKKENRQVKIQMSLNRKYVSLKSPCHSLGLSPLDPLILKKKKISITQEIGLVAQALILAIGSQASSRPA